VETVPVVRLTDHFLVGPARATPARPPRSQAASWRVHKAVRVESSCVAVLP
jgi:hypothetical protein